METSKSKTYKMIGEMIVYCILAHVVQFGVLFLQLYIEKPDIISQIFIILATVVYAILVYYAVKPDKGGEIEDILARANKKRIGLATLTLAILTIISYVYPYRPLNILAVFISLDILMSLIPGGMMFAGKIIWKQSKLLYILALFVNLFFFIVNLFGFNYQSIIWFFTNFFGIIGIIIVTVFIVILILEFIGVKVFRRWKQGAS